MSVERLKFRAWDAERKQYFYSDAYGLEGFFARHAHDPIEQFTGLKDKNGKEIYEGDILATEQLEPWHGMDQWSRDEHDFGVVEMDVTEGVRVTNDFHLDWKGIMDTVYRIEFVFVIGNIHETPELMTAPH